MKNIKVAAIAINQTPLDWGGNKLRIIQALQEAEKKQVQVLCFPELCISGYGCEDAFYSPFVIENSLKILFEILDQTANKVVAIGLPILFKGSLFNAVAIIVNKKIVGLIPKKVLAGDGVYYENRWFKPWELGVRESIELLNPLDGQKIKIPIGDFYFDIGGIKFGLEICEEAWVAQRIGAQLAQKGVEIILNPSASHFAFGKQEVRKRFVTEGSRAFGVAYIFANLLGNESGRIIFDGAGIVATNGHIVLESKRFSFQDFEVFDCVIDVEGNKIRRVQTANYKPELGHTEISQIEVSFNWNFLKLSKKDNAVVDNSSWEMSNEIKNEEFFRAVSLGLFDYLRKSKSSGFVISLSGGVDSSVVTTLAAYALLEAKKTLGSELFEKKLSYRKDIGKILKEKSWLKEFIHVAYQATTNSSKETKQAASFLAKALDISYYEWELDIMLNHYTETIEQVLHRKLTWEQDDLSLQNIQARTRSPGIWLLANIKNSLLLATSNRSEAAVGYATMDGDTSGGLSPIAGVDKAFLNQWIRWCAEKGPLGIGSVEVLKEVYKRPPTAELRPQGQGQEDEKDLMPYDVLDRIEREFIRDRKSPKDIVECLSVDFQNFSNKELALFVIKFLRLWSRNQWKRERYAPAFHLDDESLDPKTWCRYPILMSGFDEEIRGLESLYLS